MKSVRSIQICDMAIGTSLVVSDRMPSPTGSKYFTVLGKRKTLDALVSGFGP